MKFRILAIIVTLTLLATGYFVAQGFKQDSAPPSSGGRPDANDIRNLRIN